MPGIDEDTITISVEAARHAIARAGIDPRRIGALYVGSESHPYAVKPSGTVVAEALGIGPNVHVADFEFACKAGTEAMFCALSHVNAGQMDYALAIGADTSQGAPGDPLEYTASAGGAAFLFGRGDEVLGEVLHTHSITTDTPDFWRREGRPYPSHAGRYTGEPAYFEHVLACARATLEKASVAPAEIRSRGLAHAEREVSRWWPRASSASRARSSRRAFWCARWATRIRDRRRWVSPRCSTRPRAGELILLVSYGSGAGSDGFVFRATGALAEAQGRAPSVRDQLDERKRVYLDYAAYAKHRGKYRMND